ncbi:unnamed protein product [Parnassius mnemosyne]
MDKIVMFLVISLFFSPKTNGRSWHHSHKGHFDRDHGIVFEDHGEPRWHPTDEVFNEWKHHDRYESNNKRLKNWSPDRVWFPDFIDNPVSTSTPSKLVPTTLSSRTVEDCIRECPTSLEYNPVCGTDKVTYPNLGRLECTRLCGIDVRIQSRLPCSLVSEELSNPTSEDSPSFAELLRQCEVSCPATSEYNPICGTNNVTYINRGRLECAKTCGVDVEVKRLSPCPKPAATETSIIDDIYNPSEEGEDVRTTTTSSNKFTQSTEALDRLNFTIQQDILNDIFNIPTTDSNEIDIDIRQNE